MASESYTGTEKGANGHPLVSLKEFREQFAIPFKYGDREKPWPRSTILLYKYSSKATLKYGDIPENTWIRIDNAIGKHAEIIMIKDLKKIQHHLEEQADYNVGSYKGILSIEVILNYSPDSDCSNKLCICKKYLDEEIAKQRTNGNEGPADKVRKMSLTTEVEKVEKIKFKITFSNFYKHIEELYGKENMEGLTNLLKSDITLDILTDENWKYFFNAAGLVTERQRREKDDKKILQYLKGLAALDQTNIDYLREHNLV
ncbi:unnamed protein product [Mytilus coruscus]|uniref:Uncharacterized protein n=1 Tax=Mytilus coruscus TaxID=42192 RepID=A0A6J8BV56_MYTCO|nr:unnamed protein product [Mytilus coruscus]